MVSLSSLEDRITGPRPGSVIRVEYASSDTTPNNAVGFYHGFVPDPSSNTTNLMLTPGHPFNRDKLGFMALIDIAKISAIAILQDTDIPVDYWPTQKYLQGKIEEYRRGVR